MRRQPQKLNNTVFTTTWIGMLIACFLLIILGFYLLGKKHGASSCIRGDNHQLQQSLTQK